MKCMLFLLRWTPTETHMVEVEGLYIDYRHLSIFRVNIKITD